MEDEIRTYCGNVAERLRACRNREVAIMLKQQMCKEMSQRCQSEMIRNTLERYVDKLVEETFDQNGNNSYLEAL
jgi:hypothetical protein